jgi:glycosyltransferase involved in cell wall biosynthesis
VGRLRGGSPAGAPRLSAPAVDLLLPGDPGTRTGGYVYDRRVAEGLSTLGWRVRLHRLDDGFPLPGRAALGHADRVLAALPEGALTLIDGLAAAAMPDVLVRHAARLRLVALVHHPLALEPGLATETATTLARSERRALATVRQVVTTSTHTAGLLARDYAVPAALLAVVEPGTDPAAPAVGSGGPDVALLCVATLTPRKAHGLLLDALAQVVPRNWRLVCVGSTRRDHATATTVRERAAALGLGDRVVLAGEVDDAALAAHYHRADAFVLPTTLEGYGMALAEALARGLPVVSTRAGAVPDTVGDEAALLVPPGDRDALAEALTRLIGEPALRARLAAAARCRAAALPTWTAASASMAAVLDRVAAT